MHEEIKAVCGDAPITQQEIDKLKYLQNVIKETMRLYPPVALFTRKSIEDDTLGGYFIPKGVITSFNNMHY